MPLLRHLSLFILLTLWAAAGEAQRTWLPNSQRAFRERHVSHAWKRQVRFGPYKNVVTANLALGNIHLNFTASAGLSYERFLNERGTFSVTLPALVYTGVDPFRGEMRRGSTYTNISGIYAAPGALFHPVGNDKMADFGIGLALALGQFHRIDQKVDDMADITYIDYKNTFFAAILAQMSVTGHSRGHFVCGFVMRGGYIFTSPGPMIYYSGEPRIINQILIELGVKLGVTL